MIIAGIRPAWYAAPESVERAGASEVPNDPDDERAAAEPRKSAVEIAPRRPAD